MSLFIRGDEKYAKYFPVRGVVPNLYSFNNLNGILSPYVNDIQFYDKFTGQLGPKYSPANTLSEMISNFRSNPVYTEAEKKLIKTNIYRNNIKKVNIGIIGTDKDIEITRKALDVYLSK
jgi:hypothetical protein